MSYSFNSIQEFKKFVYHLSSEDIQKFSYEEWNKLYEGIDDLCRKLKLEENIDKLKEEYKKKNKEKDIDNLSYTLFFTNCMCDDEFIKLNYNFKLKERDWEYCHSVAKKISNNVYNENIIDLAKVLVNKKTKTDMAKMIDISSLKATNYADKYTDAFNFMPSNIKVIENRYSSSKGTARYKTFNTDIEIADMSDDVFNTAVHETIHAHFQQNTTLQEYAKARNDLPSGLDKSLSDLFENNQKFYIIADERFSNHLLGYSRQPIEYFAKLIGCFTEREFRKLTKQYSERTIILLNNHFTQHLDTENPIEAKYNKDVIEVFYPISSFKKIDGFRKRLPFELKEKIKFYKNNRLVKVTVQRGYNTRCELLKHIKSEENKKLIYKSARNSLLKKIPLAGIGVGTYLAIKRILKHDGAIISSSELLSGALSSLNKGIGAFYSFCIDLALYQYDRAELNCSKGFSSKIVYKAPKQSKFATFISSLKIKKGR